MRARPGRGTCRFSSGGCEDRWARSADVAGTALTFRVFTPVFLGATAIAAFACLVLVGVGLVALIVLALG